MNNAPPDIQNQCQDLLKWMQDRSDVLMAEDRKEDMFALYMEWHEWGEEDNPTLMVIGRFNEEK